MAKKPNAVGPAAKRRVDYTSVAAIPFSLALILIGQAIEGGSILSLLQWTAALIVFGGTIGAVLLSFSYVEVRRAVEAWRIVFLWSGEPLARAIDQVLEYAMIARKGGVLSLEDELPNVMDPYLRKALGHIVDGTDPDVVREMLEVESRNREEYDDVAAKVYEAAGGYAPTLGILGAVLGLIHIMQNLADPSKLGSGIAVAFVATVYGVGSANLLFVPMATKLRRKARHEALRRELMLEGVLAIQEGTNPRLISEKLRGMSVQTVPHTALPKVA